MSEQQTAKVARGEAPDSVAPAWRAIFSRELRDLWIGGKALYLILIYCVLLGIYGFLLASNAEVNLMPLKEMVLEMVKASIAVGLFIGLIIGADSISGERERSTLEGLLLTPVSRRQIVAGKFLAAVSPWPVALAIAIPYWAVLSKGDEVFGQALLWGPLLGSLLAPALVGLGMLVSIWCNTNKMSMLVSICLYLLLILPTELMMGPAKIQRTTEQWFRAELNQWVIPIPATSRFLQKVMVFQESPEKLWFWHTTPVLFTIVVVLLLFLYASPRLRLDPGTARKLLSYWDRIGRVLGSLAPQRVLRQAPTEPGGAPSEAEDVFPAPEASRMNKEQRLNRISREPSGSASPTWWLVFKRELRDLWVGGRALNFTLIYTMVLGVYAYVMSRDSVLSLVPPQEMVYELLKAALIAAVFVGLIIGADILSGDRERATLEGLLLTPASRRQIVLGKFLAAVSPWPVAMVVAIPYLKVLSQGDAVFGQAVLWGAILGTAMAPAFTALGMFVGFWCNTNKTSMFVSLCLYLFFLLPTTLPGSAQAGAMGQFFQWVNPLASPRVFLAGVLVNNRPWERTGPWLVPPFAFALLMFVLLFWYASPGLSLEARRAGRFLSFGRRAAGLTVVAFLLGFLSTSPAMAQKAAPQGEQAALKSPERPSLQISIDLEAKTVRAGTPIFYNTLVTNNGTEASSPLIVAMNIINLKGSGEPVDPEDWSPQRTQYLESLAPGQAATHSWRVNAILDGNFMVYMVVIPAPGGPEATSQPVASSGIHLTVTPFTRLNPRGVIPYAIGGPVVLGLVIFLVRRHRRREIDTGGS